MSAVRKSNRPAARAAWSVEMVPLGKLDPAPYNPRRIKAVNLKALTDELRRFGLVEPLVANKRDGRLVLVGGHQRLKAARDIGWAEVPVRVLAVTETEERTLNLALNNPRLQGEWDDALLASLLAGMPVADAGLAGFSDKELTAILGYRDGADVGAARATLAERFGVPPFTVLDGRQGYWQARKRAWLALGIRSELGRSENLLNFSDAVRGKVRYDGHKPRRHTASLRGGMTYNITPGPYDGRSEFNPGAALEGTSIFDPVLCELLYRWFCPPGGAVLDPFAGGSVRGVVAGILGRPYIGIDLSHDQVRENTRQWKHVIAAMDAPPPAQAPAADDAFIDAPTPVQTVKLNGARILVKRDDLFRIAGARGGKARACWSIASADPRPPGLVTAGSRQSPQAQIVAAIGRHLGIPVRIHCPSGPDTPEIEAARAAGAEVVQHRAGRNSVIVARARADAAARGWREVPFGMECEQAAAATAEAARAADWRGVKRIVVPVGSGMSLAGVLAGSPKRLPILGVVVGADPERRLDKWAAGWRDRVQLERSALDYHDHAPDTKLGPIGLDPVYEAKCLPFLRAGDLLWCVGIRATMNGGAPAVARPAMNPEAPRWIVGDAREAGALAPGSYDFVVTCPPYGDLEVYSSNPKDLSTLPHDRFLAAYRQCLGAAAAMLKQDRFAALVVGDYREHGGRGVYRNFVSETIAAAHAAGLDLYNEAILVTSVGSLPIRVRRSFEASRKLGKTHQNVLVFVKGDPRAATRAVGDSDYGADLPEGT